MPWTFTQATRRGMELDITIQDSDETRRFTYTYPFFDGQTPAQFKAAVRKEIRAHLDHLNATVTPEDVTTEYDRL